MGTASVRWSRSNNSGRLGRTLTTPDVRNCIRSAVTLLSASRRAKLMTLYWSAVQRRGIHYTQRCYRYLLRGPLRAEEGVKSESLSSSSLKACLFLCFFFFCCFCAPDAAAVDVAGRAPPDDAEDDVGWCETGGASAVSSASRESCIASACCALFDSICAVGRG